MSKSIHTSAVIDPGAELGDDIEIGPLAVIGPGVVLGKGTQVEAGAQVMGPSIFGEGNRVFPYACVGFEPQDLKYQGGDTRLEVGDRNIFREFCTIHRGTEEGGGATTIGNDNLFMAYSHVAHDCHVGNRIIFSNAATLAGHVTIEDDATVGAFSAVHQFCRVGRYAYIGGYSVITKDALPWVKTVGQKPLCYGVNTIGLKRKGFTEESIQELESIMRLLLRSGLNTTQATDRIQSEHSGSREAEYLTKFLKSSERGVITSHPGRRGTRGGRSE